MPIRVYRAATPYEASFLVELLESQGIPALVQGERIFALRGEVAGIDAWPEVHVLRAEDVEAAKKVVEDFEATQRARAALAASAPPWTCPACDERSEGTFTECWNCGREREP